MLVVGRKLKESVTLRHKTTGEIIKVCVSGTGSAQNATVRIGFEASNDWEIIRTEKLADWVDKH